MPRDIAPNIVLAIRVDSRCMLISGLGDIVVEFASHTEYPVLVGKYPQDGNRWRRPHLPPET